MKTKKTDNSGQIVGKAQPFVLPIEQVQKISHLLIKTI